MVACGSEAQPSPADSAAQVAALRDTLVRFGIEDQRGRDSLALAVAGNDTVFLMRMMHDDSVRSRWLQAAVAANGWPRRSVVGDSAASAAWYIVQHSADAAFQARMLPILERAVAAGEVRAADVAMLADRVAVHDGQPQRYGTQFSVRDSQLVADPIADLGTLDSLRATVEMPPMREYVKLLGDLYKMPVVWPPHD